MIKRTIVVSSPGVKIRYRNGALELLYQEENSITRVPCEDIGLLMLDHKRINYTHSAIVECMKQGAAVVFCGDDHHPAGLMLPFSGNSLHTERIRAQAEMKMPLKKQLWKLIVQAKLKNQSNVLGKGNQVGDRIDKLVKMVRSGDPENCESQGSRIYFPALFGKDFRRSRNGKPPNNLLNYGYMVIRAAVAKAVCGSGLHPALGLFHHHRNNPFCLADDLMEPYRSYVDRVVCSLHQDKVVQLNKDTKQSILSLLSEQVAIGVSKGPMLVAIQKSATSLASAIINRNAVLELPRL